MMTEPRENIDRSKTPEIDRRDREDDRLDPMGVPEDTAPGAGLPAEDRGSAFRGIGRDPVNQPPENTDRLTTAELARRARGDPPTPAPEGRRPEGPAAEGEDAVSTPALFPEGETGALRSRWESIQTSFVDSPRASVKEADALVADTVARLTEMFATERSELERQWGRGDEVSTEDLRVTLRRYRSFFTRLLSV